MIENRAIKVPEGQSFNLWRQTALSLQIGDIMPKGSKAVKCRIVNLAYLNFNSKLELERQKIRSRKTDIFTEIMISNSNFLNLSPPWN